jgi:hypothetical protein
MSNREQSSSEVARTQLQQKLRAVDEQLRHELSARGFDPAQAENIALPGPLAKLYMERETLRDELESLNTSTNSTDDDKS